MSMFANKRWSMLAFAIVVQLGLSFLHFSNRRSFRQLADHQVPQHQHPRLPNCLSSRFVYDLCEIYSSKALLSRRRRHIRNPKRIAISKVGNSAHRHSSKWYTVCPQEGGLSSLQPGVNMKPNTSESDAHRGATLLSSNLTPKQIQVENSAVRGTDAEMSAAARHSSISRPLSVFQLCHIVLLVFAYLDFSSNGVDCVHINSISQPQSFRSGAANSVILDCDFTIDEDDDFVIVKWFLNDEKQHIYQWIQAKDVRIYSPKIKPYVDETFVVKDQKTRHRALRLLNPPTSLSGKYTCSVQSIANEDANSTHLVIYEPASAFDIAAVEVDEENPDDDGFNITCTAIGVFPEPEIKLYKVKSNNEDLESTEVESNGTTILSFQSVTDGLYSITLVSHIEQRQKNQTNTTSSELAELESPARERLVLAKQNQTRTKKNIAEHYECRLTIPHTEYGEVRRLAIQNGWRSKYRSNGAQSMLFAQFGHRLLCTSLTLVFAMRALAIGHHRM